jgi:hypothetical protein
MDVLLRSGDRRWRTHAVFAVAGLMIFAGCEDDRGKPPPPPSAPSARASCVTASGELIADVNDDGHPDRISDPSRSGTRFSITFGVGTADEATVGARALADYTGGRQEYVIGAAADFNRDGWTDLVIVAGDEQAGDTPIYPRTAELRLGPFSNTGRGQKILPLGLGATSEMSVVDYNHDRYPDLAVYGHVGDGERMARARLGAGASALAATAGYEHGTEFESPARLPNSGLGRFYRPCSTSDMTE